MTDLGVLTEQKMKFEVVSDLARPSFPVLFFNDPLFDTEVFKVADQMLIGYDGGYWEYVTTEHSAFLRLNDEELFVFRLVNPFSGEEVEMDSTTAGMILTFYALSRECEKGKDLGEIMYKLGNTIQDYLEETDRFDIWMKLLD